jgi:hypothetical protein
LTECSEKRRQRAGFRLKPALRLDHRRDGLQPQRCETEQCLQRRLGAEGYGCAVFCRLRSRLICGTLRAR